MKTFCLVALIASGILAGASVLSLPVWLLGVPGVEGTYAKGWKLGLFAVLLYPITWAVLFLVWRIARKHADVAQEATLNLWIGAISLVLLAVGAMVVLWAFKLMSRS